MFYNLGICCYLEFNLHSTDHNRASACCLDYSTNFEFVQHEHFPNIHKKSFPEVIPIMGILPKSPLVTSKFL